MGFKVVYNKLLGKYLVLTNTVSCGLLLACGDVLQQQFERINSNKKYNIRRTGRMFAIGFILGPMTHTWYKILDRIYPLANFQSVWRKILLDQLIGAPMFCGTFVIGMSCMEGQTWPSATTEFVNKFPMIYAADWCFWPPVQTVNFYLVSSRFRALYVYFADLCWYTFGSYIKHRDQRETELSKEIQADYDPILPLT